VLPHNPILLTLNELAQWTIFKTDIEEPNLQRAYTDISDPYLAMFLTDSDDPKLVKSSTDKELPNATFENTDIDEPQRANDLKDKAEPNSYALCADRTVNLHSPDTLKVEPNLM
jgi:hypothetical protein